MSSPPCDSAPVLLRARTHQQPTHDGLNEHRPDDRNGEGGGLLGRRPEQEHPLGSSESLEGAMPPPLTRYTCSVSCTMKSVFPSGRLATGT